MWGPGSIERGTISRKRGNRINREIRVREVRLIDENGKQLGIYPTREALRMAEDRDLDLVEIAPQARPPVCRLLNYGKFMYEQQRRQREARKAQKQVEVKEIQIRPKTAEHDINVKLNRARKFLEQGSRIRVRVRFRGREMAHLDIARDIMDRVKQDMSDVAIVDSQPRMEGRAMIMMLSPSKRPAPAAPEKKDAAAKPAQ